MKAKPTWQRPAGLCGIAFLLATLAAGAAAQEAQDAAARMVEPARVVKTELELGRGRATWYGGRFHGRRTSNGERFNMGALTAAHENLPFGARVRVRNLANGREVVVRINDRAPHLRDRIIDLSKAAAAALGIVRTGAAPVVILQE